MNPVFVSSSMVKCPSSVARQHNNPAAAAACVTTLFRHRLFTFQIMSCDGGGGEKHVRKFGRIALRMRIMRQRGLLDVIASMSRRASIDICADQHCVNVVSLENCCV